MDGQLLHRDKVFFGAVNAALRSAAALDITHVESLSQVEVTLRAYKQATGAAMCAELKSLACEVVLDGQTVGSDTLCQADYCFVSGLVDVDDILTQIAQGVRPEYGLSGASVLSLVSEDRITHSAVVDVFGGMPSWLQVIDGRFEWAIGGCELPLGRPTCLQDKPAWAQGGGDMIPIVSLALAQTGHQFHRYDAHPLHVLQGVWAGGSSMAVLSPHDLTPAVVAATKGFNESTDMVMLRPNSSGQRLERTTLPFIYTTSAQAHWTITTPRAFADELLDLRV